MRLGNEKATVLITSSVLGRGAEELGTILMRNFIISVTETGFLPERIIFINSGVMLAAEGSPVLEELKKLIESGVQIFACGTCLDYYQVKDKLGVGRVTNMYDIAEYLRQSDKYLTL